MKRSYPALLLFGISLLLLLNTSCENNEPKSAIYQKEVDGSTLNELAEEVYDDSLLTFEEKIAFSNALQKYYPLPVDSLDGKTVGSLIDEQMDANLQRQKNSTTSLASSYILRNTVPAKLTRFQQITDQAGRDNNRLTFQVGNKSDSTITKVSGLFKIYNNTNNTLIKQYTVNLNEPIDPGKGLERNMLYLHDSTNNRDRFIRENLKNGVLRVDWIPDTVTWESGKTIAVAR